MATVIVMPRLSPTMEEGVLAKWLKKEGDKIAPGDIIAEVETDKANMDFPLEDEGVLLKQLATAGQTVRLGAPVAILGEKGEDISALVAEATGGGGKAAAPAAEGGGGEAAATEGKGQAGGEASEGAAAEEEAAVAEQAEGEAESGQATKQPAKPAGKPAASAKAAPAGAKAAPAAADQAAPAPAARPAPTPPPPGAPTPERTTASPLARRLAGDAGLDIRAIAGSGPGGRVIKRDIEKALSQAPAAASPTAAAPSPAAAPRAAVAAPTAPAAVAPAALQTGDETVPLSMMRRSVAKRLTEAKQTVPHFYLTSEAPMDALWQFREEVNKTVAAAGGEKVSVNDFILKALARALRVVPAANMGFGSDGVSAIRHQRVDVSVAVAMEDGLITPVVRNADTKSLGALAKEVKELAQRGRDKKLRPEEYTGGTFGLTNLGMYGIREFYAIVNPPESGILAVGQVEKRAVVVETDQGDQVRIERRLTLTLSCDHRVIDGALGARLLAEVVRGLAQPMLLVL
jgi:pyruvate dehydrogenase E2 component (dihydrolipoamide acetyltransferase)